MKYGTLVIAIACFVGCLSTMTEAGTYQLKDGFYSWAGEIRTIHRAGPRPGLVTEEVHPTTLDLRPDQVVSDVTLAQIDLWAADFSGVEWTNVNLYSASLQIADFRNAMLDQCNIWHGIVGVDFRGASITNTYLAGYMNTANFDGADLSHSRIQGNASWSHFGTANVANVDFSGAILNNVDLRFVQNWETADWSAAYYGNGTLLPDGFDPAAEGMIYIPAPCSVSAAVAMMLFRRRR